MNINELIEQRVNIKNQIDELNAQIKDLQEQIRGNETILLKELDAQGLSRTANDKASVSINEDTVPDVTDWDELYAHIIDTKDFSLLQRRPSSTAYTEILKLGENVPGLQPRTVRKLNMRKL